MHFIFENCNDAWPTTVQMIQTSGVIRNSRNGRVSEYPDPVTITYERPYERVLFCPLRNINPFLHFFEPLWILAGRRDVEFLSNIVGRFRDYSDDGKVFNAAYGHRLRYPNDQIAEAIKRLKRNPDDRQVVLQIRKPDDIYYTGKDTACNLSIALKVRNRYLDIHVFNRSNDVVWGGPAGGANYPQFTTIQEYIAGHVGCGIGRYHHTTDSMHAYIDSPDWDRVKDVQGYHDLYLWDNVPPYRLFDGLLFPELFDQDLQFFFSERATTGYATSYFKDVVGPMWAAFQAYKRREQVDFSAIRARDWAFAVESWLARKNKA
jgi:thymidylate synthase